MSPFQILFIFSLIQKCQLLNRRQSEAICDLAVFLKTPHLTLSDKLNKPIENLKHFSNYGIYLNVKNNESIFNMVRNTVPEQNTIIIIKYGQFRVLFEIFENSTDYEDVRPIRDKWIWVLLMDPSDILIDAEFNIPFDVQVVIFEPRADEYYLWEQYHIIQGSNETFLRQTKMGFWTLEKRLVLDAPIYYIPSIAPPSIYSRRDMSNATFAVRSIKNRSVRKRLPSTYLQMIELSTELIDTYELFFNFKQKYLTTYAKEKFHLVGCDIITYDTIPSQGNKLPKDTIGPLAKWTITLYYQRLHENPLATYTWAPFQPDVWFVMIAWIVVAALCLALCRFFYFKTGGGYQTFIRILFSVFEAFCGQGSAGELDQSASRIADTSIWITVIYVTASYSAIILSYILIRNPYVPFENMQDFINDGTYRYGGNAYTLQMFVHKYTPNDSVISIAAEKYMDPNDMATFHPREGIRRICDSTKYAFLSFEYSLENEYSPCQIDRMKEPYYSTYLGIPGTLNFPYMTAFLKRLAKLRCTGILTRALREFRYKINNEKEAEEVKVDMKLLKSIFFILFYAMALSVILLLIENIYFNIQKPKSVIGQARKMKEIGTLSD